MDDSREIALTLLNRLIAGERDDLPWHLALLLEKSFRLDRGDDFEEVEGDYRRILPHEFDNLRFSSETSREIIATLCAEISRNPDHYLISTSLSTGADLAIRTVSKILIDPPRQLSLCEYAIALSYLTKFLPSRINKDTEFLQKYELERLTLVVKEIQNVLGDETNEEKSARDTIGQFAPQLLISFIS